MRDNPEQEPAEWPEVMEQCVEEEVLDWYRLTPQERWNESLRLWQTYLLLGGSLDPEPDSQSPFYDAEEHARLFPNSGATLPSIRRSEV
ncbi:MAG TPA: hypothetical protein VFH27_08380 [Longimicrobiaceae bacterium]|nr:hypothetical protein [Longimicrobiaceae bacterium]